MNKIIVVIVFVVVFAVVVVVVVWNRYTLVCCNPFGRLDLFVVFQKNWNRTGILIETSMIYLCTTM